MPRWRGLDAVPADWGRGAVTIGVFDGVHRGHQQIIGYLVKRASELGVRSVVVTFDPHPAEVVRPGSHPAMLTDQDTRAELIEALGVDAVCVVPFTPEFSRLPAETFVREVLVERLRAALVVVGGNFRFGRGAQGDVRLLRDLGDGLGFSVEQAEMFGETGTVYSSTYIRDRIAAGDVADAARALGRPHRVTGVVVRGDGRGRQIGFPTANLRTDRYAAIPSDGVYAGWLITKGRRLAAAISVGTNPTFHGESRRVEAYALDFSGDLYGAPVALEFGARLREMRTYDGVAPLVAQIREDVERTRSLLVSPGDRTATSAKSAVC